MHPRIAALLGMPVVADPKISKERIDKSVGPTSATLVANSETNLGWGHREVRDELPTADVVETGMPRVERSSWLPIKIAVPVAIALALAAVLTVVVPSRTRRTVAGTPSTAKTLQEPMVLVRQPPAAAMRTLLTGSGEGPTQLMPVPLRSITDLSNRAIVSNRENSSESQQLNRPLPPLQDLSTHDMKSIVIDLQTSMGDISIMTFPDIAPNHARNFIELSRAGFYDGTKFHRIVPRVLVQAGDPNTRVGPAQTWGKGGSSKTLAPELSDFTHRRGIVSMALADDSTMASSQFFICLGDDPWLDHHYTVFGEVTKGMDVVNRIVANWQTFGLQKPVTIRHAVLHRLGT